MRDWASRRECAGVVDAGMESWRECDLGTGGGVCRGKSAERGDDMAESALSARSFSVGFSGDGASGVGFTAPTSSGNRKDERPSEGPNALNLVSCGAGDGGGDCRGGDVRSEESDGRSADARGLHSCCSTPCGSCGARSFVREGNPPFLMLAARRLVARHEIGSEFANGK